MADHPTLADPARRHGATQREIDTVQFEAINAARKEQAS